MCVVFALKTLSISDSGLNRGKVPICTIVTYLSPVSSLFCFREETRILDCDIKLLKRKDIHG